MDEQQFKTDSSRALDSLYKKLAAASEEAAFEADFSSGALTVEFDDSPAKFVISPNSPVRQIWVSAHSKSYKLDWNPARNTFMLPGSGQTLDELIAGEIGQELGESIAL